jgi:hypothetical protein
MRFNKITAKINGEDKLFVFTMSTIADFCKLRGLNPSNLSEAFSGTNALNRDRDLIYCAYVNGFRYNDEPDPKVNLYKFEEMLSEMNEKEYLKVLSAFVDSMKVPEAENTTVKKKATKTNP